ncbi:hypothetical protein BDV96DRAFT_203460 [Lophiotrema nucula]|uniref:BZIP domain-containing protein n=1 Tax=Lophiotrema nucula TaxID=690887 RepID=A0A6A5ZPJ7_9PLEO|nr:hypothetical protein BDV96DRAFT_203460 [Lophiotrema nucula]
MSDSKITKQQNLARIRDNQRRSRARRKEYLQELEAKLRSCEQVGVEASTEIQTAARRVLEENRRLRTLLHERGVADSEIAAVIGLSDRNIDATPASTSLNAMLGRKLACSQNTCAASPGASSPPSCTSVPSTIAVAPIAIPARRAGPLSEYDSCQSPLSISSSVDTPPHFDNTAYYPMPITQTPEVKRESMTPFSYDSYDRQSSTNWSFQNEPNYTATSMAYYNTSSCIDAANIIRTMAVNIGTELEADLGCPTADQDCYVDNSMVFNMMEKYSSSAPVNGMM